MASPAGFETWADISLRDVALAYHKAKCDSFFERSTVDAIRFAEYEENLEERLRELHKRIQADDVARILKAGSREYEVVPKKLTWRKSPKKGANENPKEAPDWVWTNEDQRLDELARDHDPQVELRVCAKFDVDAQIIGALWINLVGHRFDEVLGAHSYGSRLRRFRSHTGPGRPRSAYHLEGRGSFEPYIHPYRRWRSDAFASVRRAIDEDKDVLVLMLDLSAYYHKVDPAFVTMSGFQQELAEDPSCRVELSDIERTFTCFISTSFATWGREARKDFGLSEGPHWGLPIGSSAARVLANILLRKWDRAVVEGLTPLFYGRYVDDMILVLQNPGGVRDVSGLFDFLAPRLVPSSSTKSCLRKSEEGAWSIDLGESYAGKSRLELKASKLKVFFLEGESGKDFLATLDHETRQISSERRLLPEPDLLDESFAARLLTATEQPGDDADSFGRAGTLSVRRYAWSVALRKAEILALDLPPHTWAASRREFFRFARTHVICADKLLNHTDTLGRIVTLAVSCGDSATAALLKVATNALAKVQARSEEQSLHVNGEPVRWNKDPQSGWAVAWDRVERYLKHVLYQAVARAWTSAPAEQRRRFESSAVQSFTPPVENPTVMDLMFPEQMLERHALQLFRADLARTPIADFVFPTLAPPEYDKDWFDVPRERTTRGFLEEVFGNKTSIGGYKFDRFSWVSDFVDLVRATDADWPPLIVTDTETVDLTPMFFATRPIGARSIAHTVPESVAVDPSWAKFSPASLPREWTEMPPSSLWAFLLRALRCVAASPAESSSSGSVGQPPVADNLPPTIELPNESSKSRSARPQIALANLKIEDDWWASAAAGRPCVDASRYARLTNLVNDALRLRPVPDYLVLPELSVPRRWFRSVARFLNDGGIGLIAGVEYGHGKQMIDRDRLGGRRARPQERTTDVASQVAVSVQDTRLGFPAVTEVWQTKTRAAPHEAEQLYSIYGKKWNGGVGATNPQSDKKPVLHHGNLYFGLLVCSELRNVKYRLALQGNVDLALVVSWNTDLVTFQPLIESAALDIHAYVGIVNNARYGDTWLRVPAREHHERDVCRVRGGRNDYAVVAELDVESLRGFHSHALDWAHLGDRYKPFPEGFNVSPLRWRVPGKSGE